MMKLLKYAITLSLVLVLFVSIFSPAAVAVTPILLKGTVTGSVTTTNGDRVSSCTVNIYTSMSRIPEASVLTDSHGKYAIQLPAGTYNVIAERDDVGKSVSVSVTVIAFKNITKDITIASIPAHISMSFDKPSVNADGEDIVAITTAVTDAFGKVPGADCRYMVWVDADPWNSAMGSMSINSHYSGIKYLSGVHVGTSPTYFGWVKNTSTASSQMLKASTYLGTDSGLPLAKTSKTINIILPLSPSPSPSPVAPSPSTIAPSPSATVSPSSGVVSPSPGVTPSDAAAPSPSIAISSTPDTSAKPKTSSTPVLVVLSIVALMGIMTIRRKKD